MYGEVMIDEVKVMMWDGENHRGMFNFLTNNEKEDEPITTSGENFEIDHTRLPGGLILVVREDIGCIKYPVKIGDYVVKRKVNGKWCFSVADGEYHDRINRGESTYIAPKKKPIDIFESPEQLETILREWQHRLFLDGWLILAHIEDEIVDVDGNVRDDVAGLNTLIYEASQANIQILSEKSYNENNNIYKQCQEKDLVHELLHCKYAYMESNHDTYESVQLELMEHQRLEEMAKSLIMAKYGVDYDYFM